MPQARGRRAPRRDAPVINFAQTQDARLDQISSDSVRERSAMQLFQGCDKLTPRELEVVELILERLSSKEMARVLGISYRTVEVHRARIRSKLGVRKIADLQPDLSTHRIVNESPTPARRGLWEDGGAGFPRNSQARTCSDE
jgi:DNA-binding CsgD family transcriptional regulator